MEGLHIVGVWNYTYIHLCLIVHLEIRMIGISSPKWIIYSQVRGRVKYSLVDPTRYKVLSKFCYMSTLVYSH